MKGNDARRPTGRFSDPAARLVRKGSDFETSLCGPSPPVLPQPTMARQYTFCASMWYQGRAPRPDIASNPTQTVPNLEQCPCQGQSGLVSNSARLGKSEPRPRLGCEDKIGHSVATIPSSRSPSLLRGFSLTYFHRMDDDSSDNVRHRCACALSRVIIRLEEKYCWTANRLLGYRRLGSFPDT
jgi:hypothetical protein